MDLLATFLIYEIHFDRTMQDERTKEVRRNCIPTLFQKSSQKIAVDVVKQFLTEDVRMIGLGSGAMAGSNCQRNFKIALQRQSGMYYDLYAN